MNSSSSVYFIGYFLTLNEENCVENNSYFVS
jgi:hypothetical protein